MCFPLKSVQMPVLRTTFDPERPKDQGYIPLILALSGSPGTRTRTSDFRFTVSQYSVAGYELNIVLVAINGTLCEACFRPKKLAGTVRARLREEGSARCGLAAPGARRQGKLVHARLRGARCLRAGAMPGGGLRDG